MPGNDPTGGEKPLRPWDPIVRGRATLDGLEHLAGGFGTAVLALVALLGVIVSALACPVGVGLLALPTALRVLRAIANRERARLSRWGPEIITPDPLPSGMRAALKQPVTRRELAWALTHGSFGLVLGLIGISLPLYAARDITYPLWWQLLPPGETGGPGMGLMEVNDLPDTFVIVLMGLGWIVLTLLLVPVIPRLQAWPGRLLLATGPGVDLALRVAQLTATRAAAVDAHAAELRRIERLLHDGTQNRIVAVTVMLGAARRAVARDPATAEAMLENAQGAAEQALAELRGVVRSILPPVLEDRSLSDALTGLAAASPVPCGIDADLPRRCAVSVEATAYFVVAEALNNVARHSGAGRATVTVRQRDDRLWLRIVDDGRGGAGERSGSGLAGIRHRTEAHDGTFALTSPPGGPTTLKVSLPCGL
ncbi:sensor histidine kinase [Nonomuraea diastatica]|uniref:histidine kinase n=1 Tax=Nonomuraea diastatica TaxID=1848329 RepID=A0A4R4X6N8_9ACTN|nr:sensor domain-containing protein [Nonomuraea diastatica]TDD25985.1 sensor histidine kinase [Nonomuraea diastatica]